MRTDSTGNARLVLPAGRQVITVTQIGVEPAEAAVVVISDRVVRITVTVEVAGMETEAVRVSATRTEQLVEETPTRVELLYEMAVEENTLMARRAGTPIAGDRRSAVM